MKKITHYIVLCLAVAILLPACSERLDITQKGVISEEIFYQSDQDAMEAITAVYANWHNQFYNYFYLKNLLSDDQWCGGGARGDNTSYEQMNEYQFSTSSTVISGAFSSFYSIIYNANLIVDRIVPDTDVKTRVIGEAKAARAWAMMELVTLWGPVPFADHVLASSEYQQPNGDIPTIWAWIENNLKEAAQVLPSKASANGQEAIGARLTKEAALSFLGKAYVFQEKWSEAATVINQVVNSNLYELIDDYSLLMDYQSDFSSENIFETNPIDDPNNAWGQGTMLFALMINWRSDHLTAMPSELYGTGWGFYNPTSDLYNAFVAAEGVDGYRLKNTMKTLDQVHDMGVHISSYLYGHEGYFQWKFRFTPENMVTNSYGYLTHFNPRWMRYAEVLLLGAEASFKSGDAATALNYVNKIRTRARLAPLASVTMDDIKNEKRLELCFECCRFQDLVRWGDAATVLANRGAKIPQVDDNWTVTYPYSNTSYGFKSGKHELMPFPDHEMSVNQNITQNPGW